MKSKTLASAVRVLSLLLLVSATCALAQERRPVHFTRLAQRLLTPGSDYQRQPIRNAWAMVNGRQRGKGHRRLLSGYDDVRLWETTAGVLDATKGGAGAHTHHITLTNIKITWNMAGCPTYSTSPPKMGFQMNGTVSLMTGNGNIAPFETNPPSSTLQVCVTGGDSPVLAPDCEHDDGVRGPCDYAFRAAGHPWRRASKPDELVRHR